MCINIFFSHTEITQHLWKRTGLGTPAEILNVRHLCGIAKHYGSSGANLTGRCCLSVCDPVASEIQAASFIYIAALNGTAKRKRDSSYVSRHI